MPEYFIKETDINKFEKLVKDLDKLVKKIKEYEPSAHLWVTPSHVNLMAGYGSCVGEGKLEKDGDEQVIAQATILYMDCGDW